MKTKTQHAFGYITSHPLPCLNIFTLGLNSLCDSYSMSLWISSDSLKCYNISPSCCKLCGTEVEMEREIGMKISKRKWITQRDERKKRRGRVTDWGPNLVMAHIRCSNLVAGYKIIHKVIHLVTLWPAIILHKNRYGVHHRRIYMQMTVGGAVWIKKLLLCLHLLCWHAQMCYKKSLNTYLSVFVAALMYRLAYNNTFSWTSCCWWSCVVHAPSLMQLQD